jgi:hypothetical protein
LRRRRQNQKPEEEEEEEDGEEEEEEDGEEEGFCQEVTCSIPGQARNKNKTSLATQAN